MHSLDIDTLRADAARVLANLGECWSPAAAGRHVTAVLQRIHGIDRETAAVAVAQAMAMESPQ